MRMVEFTRDMRPQRAGERRVVPDAVAAKWIAEGLAKAVPSAFDARPTPPAPKPARTRYLTRKVS